MQEKIGSLQDQREKRRVAAAQKEQRREKEKGGPSYQSGAF